MNWKNALILLLALILAGVAFDNWTKAVRLGHENEVLRRTIKDLEDNISGLMTNRNDARPAELELQRKNAEDLLRLRSEATQLRTKAAEADKLRAENQKLRSELRSAAAQPTNAGAGTNAPSAGKNFSRESWTFSGYASPEATLVSAIWAMREGNPRAYLDSLSPEEAARQNKVWENKSEADIGAQSQQTVANITGFQILSSQNISDNEVQMSVFVAGPDKTEQVSVVRVGGDWKFAGFVPSPGK